LEMGRHCLRNNPNLVLRIAWKSRTRRLTPCRWLPAAPWASLTRSNRAS
jgi:hypothetical protein